MGWEILGRAAWLALRLFWELPWNWQKKPLGLVEEECRPDRSVV